MLLAANVVAVPLFQLEDKYALVRLKTNHPASRLNIAVAHDFVRDKLEIMLVVTSEPPLRA